jgi:putative transposase
MILSYRYKLKNNQRCKRQLWEWSRSINEVWNYCVDTQKKVQKEYRLGKKRVWPSDFGFNRLTSGTSKVLGVNADSVQATCLQFAQCRDQNKKCPKYRKDFGPKRSLGWIPFKKTNCKIQGNSVTYLKHKFRFWGDKRKLPKVAPTGEFIEDSRGNWYVTFYVEVAHLPTGKGEVGIDLGLHDLATLSDGTKIEAKQFYRKSEEKLGKAQRANNKKLAKAINAKIKNQRKDFLHKAAASIAKANKLIIVGDVCSSALAKTPMAKSVMDAGWFIFKTMLRYKASRHGASYLEVNESFTSQTCSSCGTLPESRPRGIAGLGIRSWVCSDCGAPHDRDVNAAKNILQIGRRHAPPVEGSPAKAGKLTSVGGMPSRVTPSFQVSNADIDKIRNVYGVKE